MYSSILAPDVAPASKCPIDSFCLNGGECSYYEMIGELVCRLVSSIIIKKVLLRHLQKCYNPDFSNNFFQFSDAKKDLPVNDVNSKRQGLTFQL